MRSSLRIHIAHHALIANKKRLAIMGAAASVEMTSKRSDINAADGSELNEAQGYVLEAVGGGTCACTYTSSTLIPGMADTSFTRSKPNS